MKKSDGNRETFCCCCCSSGTISLIRKKVWKSGEKLAAWREGWQGEGGGEEEERRKQRGTLI